jgi:signal recognition particle subunit SRP54
MTGQQSLPVAKTFDERVGVSGLILSKLDGDARGGAALSAKHVTGKPIYFAGMSEKIDGLEAFHPDRVAGRILGMGDVLTLIEKAKALEGDDDDIAPRKLKDFSLQDMLTQMRRSSRWDRQRRPQDDPGVGKMLPAGADIDERELGRVEAIISSMTEARAPRPAAAQRQPPQAHRARLRHHGPGRQPLMKTYEDMRKMMKRMGKRTRAGRRHGAFGRR